MYHAINFPQNIKNIDARYNDTVCLFYMLIYEEGSALLYLLLYHLFINHNFLEFNILKLLSKSQALKS